MLSDFVKQHNSGPTERNTGMDAAILTRNNLDRPRIPIYNPAAARQCHAFFASTVPVREILRGEKIHELVHHSGGFMVE
jgi:hypothetical protein